MGARNHRWAGPLIESCFMKPLKMLAVVSTASLLSSCDVSQLPGLDGRLSQQDSKAIGAACRHSGRALEDCFALNPKAPQAGVFEGWKDMNDYMLANQIEEVKPELQALAPKAEKPAVAAAESPHGEAAAKPAEAQVSDSSGRGRWSPRPAGAPAAEAPADTKEASAKPMTHAETSAPQPSAVAPASHPKPRPCERKTEPAPEAKKEPKSHT